ncbi:exodeoxyribonuclease 7 large subunit [Candidatus Methanoplasma termitum]|uniref:XseA protein n=1 Tax=Candidatus Methanoplasma termitum TaxID=1577791 RepID=A0A0A7LE49_9ARCH|nr:exodeoxyribonuclease VII large subunit [Candidatus Methanoplasma termitum]AIZ56567.1 exodeoxyribonuclease 7 large subunit [Candidatus Methanoplasma termitum]MCL2333814.1 exodeoxyribonuclease VII large subunit [Candidatus Methanoplasma sp.]
MAETITVTQLNTRVRSILSESPAVKDIWVMGEISNLKKYPSGHYYFTLKDSGSEIRGVMFKPSRGRIDFEPQDNMKVSAFGRVDLYVERGSYQFIVETMQRSGVGDLYLAYEALKKKLEAEGLFDSSRKRKLPLYPKVIGVVTSPTGAVIHDIITTSGRLFPADILLYPAQVQGKGAAESIVKGIESLNKEGVDIIIVGRGGGSIEDLWAFNEEVVARAIASSEAPIISAVGHETDFTIADFVADVRAPTPTGAAELALRDRKEVNKHLDTDMIRLNKSLLRVLDRMHYRFRILDSKLDPKRAEQKVSMHSMRLDELYSRMNSALIGKAETSRRRFIKADSKMDTRIQRMLENSNKDLQRYSERLESINPMKVLDRGYALVTDYDGTALTSSRQVHIGKEINIILKDGKAEAKVKKVEMR